ncbi:MAG: PCI domain-containing protein [Candidatus Lokiarchaeota archaeon]|nr:PCI domain-containing protein [Candidatus Lokiarchaeota archaeon]
MKCLYCENQKIDHTCEKCKSSFCINHIATTEIHECKKHNIVYSKAKAAERNFKCTIVEDSSCPVCKSLLRLERLSSGQYYLECTNLQCPESWNSYLKTPGLFFPSKEKLAREALRYNLIKGNRLVLCSKKLKHIIGKEICPNCFLDLLKRATLTNFSTIMESFNITADQMIKFINKYIEEERIYGIIDQKNQMFYYISPEMREKILSKFNDEGIIKVEDLSVMLDMSSEIARNVIYKLINQFQIKGSFSQDKNFYYTQKYVIDTLITKIKKDGRVTLKILASEFNLPKELVKSFCVNLMRAKAVNSYFADRGNEVITASQIYKEIKAYAKETGLFELNKLATKLKIAVELARKSLHELIKTGKVNGIFTQRREFMTFKHLETKIKDLARAYRTMPLRELSNRLGVTESSIEENLAQIIARGDIDGYIDMSKRTFVAYSVPMGESPSTKPKTTQPSSKGKVEVVREYDFIGGQLHMKIVVRNNSDMAINSVKVILDAPSSYNIKNPLINIPVIEAKNSRGVDFYLEPKECGISSIGGDVIYKTASGEKNTIHIQKKEVQIKCPLVVSCLSTIEDVQLSIQDLPNDARAFLVADLDPRLAYRAAVRTLKRFEVSTVMSHEGKDAKGKYEAESWHCSEAKVGGGRIITRIYVSEVNQSLEVRVWCGEAGQLTGFLAKVIELLFEEINIIRKIKSEEREKTIDVMAITQNLAEISDYCMLRWKAQNIRNKLHDTFVRVRKVIGDNNEAVLGRIEFWLTELNKYGKDEKISEENADKLVNDVENFKSVIARSIKL